MRDGGYFFLFFQQNLDANVVNMEMRKSMLLVKLVVSKLDLK